MAEKNLVTPRSHGYGDVTATYIRRSEIPTRIYVKHKYKQKSEYVKRSIHSYANMRSTSYKVITGCDILLHNTCILYHSQVQKYYLQYEHKMLTSWRKIPRARKKD